MTITVLYVLQVGFLIVRMTQEVQYRVYIII